MGLTGLDEPAAAIAGKAFSALITAGCMSAEGVFVGSPSLSHGPGNLDGIALGFGATCSLLFQEAVDQWLVMPGRCEVEGGDNEDNQTQGPLIDMVAEDVDQYRKNNCYAEGGRDQAYCSSERRYRLTLTCNPDARPGMTEWVCTSYRGAC